MLREFFLLAVLLTGITIWSLVESPYEEAEFKGLVLIPGGAYVILETRSGNLTMVVSEIQGVAIRSILDGVEYYRPPTHYAMADIASTAGVSGLFIQDLVNNTYFAKIKIRGGDVDIRPSDGLVVCLKNECPVYISSHLFEKTT